MSTLLEVIQLLSENPNIVMDEHYAGEEVEKTAEPSQGSSVSVWGNISAFVERLDDELFKSLQVRHPLWCLALKGDILCIKSLRR